MSERSPRERTGGERTGTSALEGVGAVLKHESREIAGEARSAAYRVACEQRDAVSSFISALVGAASRGAEELEESGFARSAAAVKRTAGEVGGLAERLQQRDPGDLWDDIEDFARDHPAVVFGAGFALAFGVARFLRSGAPDDMPGSDESPSYQSSAGSSPVGSSPGGSSASGSSASGSSTGAPGQTGGSPSPAQPSPAI